MAMVDLVFFALLDIPYSVLFWGKEKKIYQSTEYSVQNTPYQDANNVRPFGNSCKVQSGLTISCV